MPFSSSNRGAPMSTSTLPGAALPRTGPTQSDRLRGSALRHAGERTFSLLTASAGATLLLLLGGVTAFLFAQAWPALVASPGDLAGAAGNEAGTTFWRYVGPFVFGTLWVSALAMALATPLAIGVALFISHYAPRRLAASLGYLVDLLAAVPSVVYGLWGITVLAPLLQPVYGWLAKTLGWLPFFAGPASGTGRTVFTVALVLAVMVLPIVTAISREVFSQTPALLQEGALALGATKWEMIRLSVLPHGRSGIISAMMLGLGRALGETMAVAMVLSPAALISFSLIASQNSNTIAANIALNFPEAFGLGVNVLVGTGLVLFAITFLVNAAARVIISRHSSPSGALQ